MTTLPSYLAYKDSGVPLLGEIPAHWHSKPLKRWVRINAEVLPEDTVDDFEFRYLDIGAVGTGILTAKPQRLRFGGAPSRARRVLRRGDTIISTVRTYLKAVFFVSEDASDLIASTGFAVLRPGQGVDPRFLSFLVQSDPFTDRVGANSVGTAYPAIAETRLGTFHVAIPPLAEQLAIACYLDHIDHRIRRAIRAKQRVIALLDEQKQAIIHQAVTRGLDPSVRLKPSGVEWLGEVPEHWEVVRLKNVAQVQTGLTLGKNYGSSVLAEYPYLRVANVQTGYLDLKHVTTVRVPFIEAAGCKLQYGDVLMTEGGDRDKLGRGCIWRGEIEDCLHQNHIFAVRANPVRLLPEFLVLLMASGHGRYYFEQTAKQTTNLASTNSTTLRAFPLFLPNISEQRLLLDKVVDETTGLDQAIDRAQREIALLREYRTRLIADVVTGKVDVRAAAQGLADEVEELETLDEVEAMGDTGEESAHDLDAAPGEDAE